MICNSKASAPLVIRQDSRSTTIPPDRTEIIELPDGYHLTISAGDSRLVARLRTRLGLWQSAAIMTFAALLFSLTGCTGTSARSNAPLWSDYARGTGQIIQTQEEK